jgi:acetoin utilization deacetylase AcuC-like enzyme
MPPTLLTHEACGAYDLPPPFPDRAQRLSAISDQLIAAGLDPLLRHREAAPATDEALAVVHDPAYLADLAATEPDAGTIALDGDTLFAPGMVAAVRAAAGAALAGLADVLAGNGPAFALTRPPGHHAGRSTAAGFCLVNHAALAAVTARARDLKRVAVVDFDAHHGDGTEALVADDRGIRLFSLYEAEGFQAPPPGTGPGGSLRLALPRGSDGREMRGLVEKDLLPALANFGPELVVMSAGFDGHREDDLSGLLLTEADYAWLTARLRAATATTAPERLLFILEGGYAPGALGRSVAAVLDTLLGAY